MYFVVDAKEMLLSAANMLSQNGFGLQSCRCFLRGEMDALGPEWKGKDTGMVALKPGTSITWHVRLEMFDPPVR